MTTTLIHILRPDAGDGRGRVEDDVDETALVKTEGLVDNDHERTTTVEYCLRGCPGIAHRTGIAEASSYFCAQHVHRSVHVRLKEWPAGLGGDVGEFL